MSDHHLELGDELTERACLGCGGPIRGGQGFVSDEQGACAIYWFDLHAEDDVPGARLLVVLDRGTDPEQFVPGRSFVVAALTVDGEVQCTLAEPDAAPVVLDPAVSGQTLSRHDALHAPDLPLLWEVLAAVTRDDPAVADFLGTGG